MKKTISILIIFTFSSFLFSQEQPKELNNLKGFGKNSAYVTVGLVHASLNYERMIAGFDKGLIRYFFVKGNIGSWAYDSIASEAEGGLYMSLNTVFLSGSRNGHVEFSIGLTRMDNRKLYDARLQSYNIELGGDFPPSPSMRPSLKDYTYIRPAGSIGYRYQSPDPETRIIFRTGIGYPEVVYASVGLTF